LFCECCTTQQFVGNLIFLLNTKIKALTNNKSDFRSLWYREDKQNQYNNVPRVSNNVLMYWLFAGYIPANIKYIVKQMGNNPEYNETTFLDYILKKVNHTFDLIEVNKKKFDQIAFIQHKKDITKQRYDNIQQNQVDNHQQDDEDHANHNNNI